MEEGLPILLFSQEFSGFFKKKSCSKLANFYMPCLSRFERWIYGGRHALIELLNTKTVESRDNHDGIQ